MEKIKIVLNLIRIHKGKFFLTVLASILFLFLLFPFNDLSDLISSQVAKATGNSVFLQFEQLSLSPIPLPHLGLKKVSVETLSTPQISAESITITPSITGLIQKKPYGSIDAQGLMKGDISFSFGGGKKSDNGVERQKIELKAEKISLHEVRKIAGIPLPIKGQLNIETLALADLSFTEQPDVDLTLHINHFELPTSNLQTSFGPMTIPEIKISQVELKGRLASGKFIIENGTIGKDSDEISGSIKGDMGVNIQNSGGSIQPIFGAYNLDIKLNTKKNFQDRAGLFLALLTPYKTPTDNGAAYKFKMSAVNVQLPPQISAAQ